ncbi:hypothetical protein AX17_003636 [Amanita inopinata Kibby_2008]|nr:hypothetical protein AX17_003636 [Amanita inopinata Kibby_2008]
MLFNRFLRLSSPEDLEPLFQNDDYVGCTGLAIADYVESNNLQANPETKKRFNIFVGASVGPEVEDHWARLDMGLRVVTLIKLAKMLEKVLMLVVLNLPTNTFPIVSDNPYRTMNLAQLRATSLNFSVSADRLPGSLLPLQSGIGNVANSIIGGLADGSFEQVQVWTEVLQDTFLRFFDSGKLSFATATSIRFPPNGFSHFYANWSNYKDRLLLRLQQVANSPEIIRRLGAIAMNTPVEVDAYAHANSTCVLGSRMLNGLGGSGDFLRNAKLSIMHTPSSRPTKTDPTGVSCIVPFSLHVDHTEHDLDMIVTEQGLVDLRRLSPRERAPVIIEKCAHPHYKDLLREMCHFDAVFIMEAGHEPHMLRNAFKFHTNLEQHGTMKIEKWD